MFKLSHILWCASVALSVACLQSAQAQVVATIERPGIQSSSVAGITTETFDSFSPGVSTTLNSVIGVYTSPGMAVLTADQFGGAGGAGNYFSIGAQSSELTSTLTLTGDTGYFGFWFSAGDNQNQIQLFENSTLIYTLDTQGLLNFINMQPNSAAYYGNPNSGQDTAEPFAYVNFFGTNGTVFNKIVFTNFNLGSGFESDNHSVGPAAPITGTPITPEPGTWAMMVIGSLSGAAFFHRKRRR